MQSYPHWYGDKTSICLNVVVHHESLKPKDCLTSENTSTAIVRPKQKGLFPVTRPTLENGTDPRLFSPLFSLKIPGKHCILTA